LKKMLAVLPIAVLLSACGNSAGERGVTGAGLGAGVGAAGAAVTGGSALTGALVGGVVGGAAGALTDKDDINLGDPVWK